MSRFNKLLQFLLYNILAFVLAGCVTPNPNLDANDPDVETYLGVNFKTTLPQEFDYVLYSRHGTFDRSIRVTNSGTLVFGEEGLHYSNNTDEISIKYDDIVSVKRLTVPLPKGAAFGRRDTWLAIRFQDGDKIRRVGFRGDVARAHPWTGDRLVGLLRYTLAARQNP